MPHSKNTMCVWQIHLCIICSTVCVTHQNFFNDVYIQHKLLIFPYNVKLGLYQSELWWLNVNKINYSLIF